PGGPASSSAPNGEPPLGWGETYRARPYGGLEPTGVLDDGPAQRAGLEPGDVLIALDRLKVDAGNLAARLKRFEDGERISATVFRGDELLEFGLVLAAAPRDTCWLQLRENADEQARARREAWLAGSA